jgi:hypothetical protein
LPEFSSHRPLFHALSAVGFILWLRELRVFRAFRLERSPFSIVSACTAIIVSAAICAAICAALFARPVWGWDALSIWFLHAKMIFTAKTTGAGAGWGLRELLFSHPDYPKLNAILAAEFLETWGQGWDLLAAKSSLLVLFFAVFLGTLSAPVPSKHIRLALLGVLVVLARDKLWSGYQDAQTAAFSLLGFLYWSPLLEKPRERDAAWNEADLRTFPMIGCGFWILATQLKNEGLLSVLALALPTALFAGPTVVRSISVRKNWRRTGLALLFLLGPVSWSVLKYRLGLQNDLDLLGTEFRAKFLQRLMDGNSFQTISRRLLFGPDLIAGVGLLAFVVATVVAILRTKHGPKRELSLMIGASLYTGAIHLIYLGTYHDLLWHLGTSSQRVMFFVGQTSLVALVLSFDDGPRSSKKA